MTSHSLNTSNIVYKWLKAFVQQETFDLLHPNGITADKRTRITLLLGTCGPTMSNQGSRGECYQVMKEYAIYYPYI